MNVFIETLAIQILEEGMTEAAADVLVKLLTTARAEQEEGKADEIALKDVWWDAYHRNEIAKTLTVAGVKMQCNDASAPKQERIPGYYEIDVDKLLTDYDPAVLVETGIAKWVPPSTVTKAGRKGGVAVTFPKGQEPPSAA